MNTSGAPDLLIHRKQLSFQGMSGSGPDRNLDVCQDPTGSVLDREGFGQEPDGAGLKTAVGVTWTEELVCRAGQDPVERVQIVFQICKDRTGPDRNTTPSRPGPDRTGIFGRPDRTGLDRTRRRQDPGPNGS